MKARAAGWLSGARWWSQRLLQHPLYRKVFWFHGLLLGLLLTGMMGYHLLEGWSWFDSLYMTVITLATIGYGETHPLSDAGRWFTILLIVFGSGLMLYTVSGFITSLLDGDIRKALKHMTLQRTLAGMSGHIILCGYSQTGQYAVDELRRARRPFVVIDMDPAKLEALQQQQVPCLLGDATGEALLQEAGIERAHGLIATLHHDADNLFVVLTARGLNPALRIIAKAVEESSLKKLKQVGADSVVMPNFIGGLRMVSEMVRPNVVTFLDMVLGSDNQAVRVEELLIPQGSPVAGQSLQALGLVHEVGVSLVALRTGQQAQHIFNPPPSTVLDALDTLILIGDAERIAALNQRLGLAPSHRHRT